MRFLQDYEYLPVSQLGQLNRSRRGLTSIHNIYTGWLDLEDFAFIEIENSKILRVESEGGYETVNECVFFE